MFIILPEQQIVRVITLNLGSAAGQNQYDTGVSYHYYDVVPIYFYSNGTQIGARETLINSCIST